MRLSQSGVWEVQEKVLVLSVSGGTWFWCIGGTLNPGLTSYGGSELRHMRMFYVSYFACVESDSNVHSIYKYLFSPFPFFPLFISLLFSVILSFLVFPACPKTHFLNQAGLEFTDISLLSARIKDVHYYSHL